MPTPPHERIGAELFIDTVVGPLQKPKRATLALELSQAQKATLFVAARARDLGENAYARRATLAFAAFDQGIPWLEIMQDEERCWRFTEFRNRGIFYPPDAFGPWEIEGLR